MTFGNENSISSIILDNIPVGVFLLDSGFSVSGWNNTMEKWTGIPKANIIGTPLTSLLQNMKLPYDLHNLDLTSNSATANKMLSEQLDELFSMFDFAGYSKNIYTSITPVKCFKGEYTLITLQDRSDLTGAVEKSEQQAIRSIVPLQSLTIEEERLNIAASVYRNTSIGILVTNSRGVILSVNPAFEEITGYRESDAVGTTPRFLKSGIHDPAYYSQIINNVCSEGKWKGEIWVRRKNGEIFPQDTTITAIRDDNGVIKRYSAILSDVTERKKNEEYLRFLSMRDGLTGLFNRRTFDEEMKNEWRRALRISAPFSLIILDIDYFKSYNDTYGHQQGDNCLKAVAEVINNSVHRKGDMTARYGGEEFVILLPSSSKSDALFIAEAIRSRVAELGLAHKNSAIYKTVTASLGIGTLVPSLKNSPEKLFKLADKALYAAKSQGRNRVVSYVEEGGQLQLPS